MIKMTSIATRSTLNELTEVEIAAVAGGYQSKDTDPIYYAVGYYLACGAGGVFNDLAWQLMN